MQRMIVAFLVCLMALAGNVNAELDTVEILTSDLVEFSNREALERYVAKQGGVLKVYNFDDVAKMESFLGQGLEGKTEADAAEIEAILKARFDEIGQERLNQMAKEAYMAKMLAIKFRVNSYPAVIINRKAVIYGVVDLLEVAERCRAWLNG